VQLHNLGSNLEIEDFEVTGLSEFVEQDIEEAYQDEHFAHYGDNKKIRHIQK